MDKNRITDLNPSGSHPHEIRENEQTVYDFLENTGIDYSVYFHTPAFSMEECERIRSRIGIPIFKNLFLTNKQQTLFYLLMIPADKPFKTKYLSSQLGCARLSFASPELMKQFLNIEPGAVSPLGLIHDKDKVVKLIVDKDLLTSSIYACHPCVNTASVVMTLDTLLSKIIPATGHDYTLVELPSE